MYLKSYLKDLPCLGTNHPVKIEKYLIKEPQTFQKFDLFWSLWHSALQPFLILKPFSYFYFKSKKEKLEKGKIIVEMIKLDGVIIAMSHPPYDSCSLSSLRPRNSFFKRNWKIRDFFITANSSGLSKITFCRISGFEVSLVCENTF